MQLASLELYPECPVWDHFRGLVAVAIPVVRDSSTTCFTDGSRILLQHGVLILRLLRCRHTAGDHL